VSTQPSAMPVTKQARAEISTRRLLDAAQQLIGEIGYERTTLALIAARAGYSHGLITRRFGSKENLLYALVERMTLAWWNRESSERSSGRTGRDAVLASIDLVLEAYQGDSEPIRGLNVLMFEALNSVPALRERVAKLHRTFRRDLAERVRHEIKVGARSADVDADRIARLVVTGMRGVTYQWLLDPDEIDFRATLIEFRDVIAALLPAPVDQQQLSEGRRPGRRPSVASPTD